MTMRVVVLSLLVCLFYLASAQKLNPRPIIGIVAEPPEDSSPTHSELSADYVRWLSAGGSRIAVIRYDMPEDKLETLFQSINGLLFTGGGLSLDADTQYFKTAQFLWNLAKAANDKGDFFPVWGTCMGFQLLSILGAEDHSILDNGFDSYNYSIPLTLTPDARGSRFFTTLPPQVVTTLTTQNVTQNLHHYGVPPSTYNTNTNLLKTFKLLSVNTDRSGVAFGSTIEGRDYPFYGTQWHPERNQFAWGVQEGLNKTPEAIRAMQSVANFFVGEARKNFHKFTTPAEEVKNLIFAWRPTYTGDQGTFPSEETYIFPLYNHQN